MHTDIYDQIREKFASYWETILLSIPRISLSVILIGIFVLVAIGLSRLLRRRFSRKTENRLVLNFVLRLTKFIIILFGIILALNTLGFTNLAGGLLAGAGAGAIILGFAFKEIGENFLAGILLLFDRPFNVGDTVTIQGNMGKIRALNFRTTHLKAMDGADIYIPNGAIIKNEVYNHTQDGLQRLEFNIGIDYAADVDQAIHIITETVIAHPEVTEDEKTMVLIQDFGSNVNLRILFWIKTLDFKITAAQTRMEIMRNVKNALMKNGFGMPTGVQDIRIRDHVHVVQSTETRPE